MVLRIEDIRKPAGLKKKGKRKGRGIGSGKGKTAGKGHKGAKARSGGGDYNPGFEGGQMPLVRRIPKRGFTNKFKRVWNILNIGTLNEAKTVKNGIVVDKEFLIKSGILKKAKLPVKVLGEGKLEKSIIVVADAFSEKAKKAIEEAGGKAEIAVKQQKSSEGEQKGK